VSLRAAAPLLALALGVAAGTGAARAQPWPEYEPFTFPLDSPLALPQEPKGTLRRSVGAAQPERVDRIREVFAALRACWRPPLFRDGPTGLQITLRMSFNRSGEVIGKPRITYFQGGSGDRDFQDRFVTSVSDIFRRCMPLPFTAAFGSAIAGRPFAIRFVDDRET
jgi:hypothetical protein